MGPPRYHCANPEASPPPFAEPLSRAAARPVPTLPYPLQVDRQRATSWAWTRLSRWTWPTTRLGPSASRPFSSRPPGLGLALLARPWRQLRQFGPVLIIFSLLPLMRLLTPKVPVAELSQITAWLSSMLLMLCGFPVQRLGQSLYIPGGGVAVAGSCSGSEIMVQLLAVSIIFMVAFPMRYRGQNLAMIVMAPLLAWLVNGIRIALLALITASSYPGKTWWFDFFHHEWGSQLFSGTAMVVFVVVYVHWQGRQVARLLGG